MRLLEVRTASGVPDAPWCYSAFGTRTYVEWRNRTQRGFEPRGITPDVAAERAQAIADLVNARTGLVPHTFSRTLRAPVGQGNPRPRDSAWIIGAWILGLIGTGAAALAATAVALPLTNSAPLNLLIVAPLAVLALGSAAVVAQDLRTGGAQGNVGPPLDLAGRLALPPDRDAAVYALRFSIAWRVRLAFAALGAMLLIDGIPWMLAMAPGAPGSLAPDGSPRVIGPVGYVVVVPLGLYAILGLVLLLESMSRGATTLRADATGLTVLGPQHRNLAWDHVDGVQGRVRHSRVVGYSVCDDTDRQTIHWPARPDALRPLPPSADATQVTPDELAALVAQRSGKPIEWVRG
jgi:hypothetical protein